LPIPEAAFFFGTFAPSSLASERPIAIACFLLVTFLPERPLVSVPAFFHAWPVLPYRRLFWNTLPL